MASVREQRPMEDDLRPEYDLIDLVRVPAVKIRPRTQPGVEPLELTSAFPQIEGSAHPEFEWDEAKAASNFRKHGVTFNEASTVFDDPQAAFAYDPDHSEDEDRHLIIGHSARGRVLIVSHTDREAGTRIISAREATRREQRSYENGVPG